MTALPRLIGRLDVRASKSDASQDGLPKDGCVPSTKKKQVSAAVGQVTIEGN